MIANRKQEWDLYVEQTAPTAPAKKRQLRPDAQVRSKFLILVLMIAVMAMASTLQSAFIVQTGYDVVQTKSEITKLQLENERLHLEIAKMKSPQRIQQIATRDMGMVLPQTVYHASSKAPSAGPMVAANDANHPGSSGLKMLAISRAEASQGR